jgi:Transposase and inactivated derivatives
MPESPRRKNIRLNDYDYSSNGAYFLTICVKDRHELLGEINVGTNCVRPRLSEHGVVVEKEIAMLNSTYKDVKVDKYIIMPNHIHMIIFIMAENGRTQGSGRTQFVPTVSRIIKQFKGSVTKQIGFSMWQPRFYDHIIRDKDDYSRICQYIEENPAKWTDDQLYCALN